VGQRITFTCIRQAPGPGRCRLSQAGWLGTAGREIALEEVQRAVVDGRGGGASRGGLLTRHGPGAFMSYATGLGTGEMATLVARINAYLDNPDEPALTVEQDTRRWAYPVGGVFLGFGFFLLLAGGRVESCTVDKSQGTVTVIRRGLMGTKVITH